MAAKKKVVKKRAAKRSRKKAPKLAKRPACAAGAASARRRPAGKVDLVKERPDFFKAGRAPEVVTLPRACFLAIEGKGSPESEAFQSAFGALFGVAYTLKFAMKEEGSDFKVAPPEGLWWSDYDASKLDDPEALWTVPREEWRWKLAMMVPDFVKSGPVESAKRALFDRRGDATAKRVGFERMREGKCVQALHVGPYSDEPATIGRMRELMAERDLVPHGFHHEIYLSDPRRTAPEKTKTILRQPVRKQTGKAR
ncbi:MAG: GyrI-like domain-containing protein [Planctomycetota bacterium]